MASVSRARKGCPYGVITDRIVELLERGVIPWRKPWVGGEPANLNSGRHYRGVNIFLLAAAGYASPYWVTYKQAQSRGGHVRKGEKSWPVDFWKWLEVDDRDKPGRKKRVPFLRYYRVFNVAQCEGIDAPAIEGGGGFDPVDAAERIAADMPNKPAIITGEPQAYYRPSTDTVNMPARELFSEAGEYYNVLFHELAHSTGHKSRLDRPGIGEPIRFGSPTYSREELVAEMGAAFLCGAAGIDRASTIENSAAYIAGWLRKLKDDRKLVVLAAAQAQKAADYIRGIRHDSDGEGGGE